MMKIEFAQKGTKGQQLIDALTVAIGQGQYKRGDFLPSINLLSKEVNVSRDTVFKAYAELKRRGLVASMAAKGYYVNGAVNKVFMLLDTFSPFKDVLYNAVISHLPHNYTVDLLFHHYNLRVFESVIADSLGRYGKYVVMNFDNEKINDMLQKIDKGKLLILDMGKHRTKDDAYVCQDFDQALYQCLQAGWALLRRYRRLVLYFPDTSPHPRSSIRYFKRFCKDYNMEAEVATRIEKSDIQCGTAYLVIPQKELVEMVKFCRDRRLNLGRDVGLIAYNDSPLYEVIDRGVTVISTDFAAMGKRAAEFIKSGQKIQEIVPTQLILRGTL
ncbi:MAG: GntR family transcriptional regulator [Bacteroidales bacterium]|jgi:DNA-binding transcriptional regulator YhcF (GntR family)|nr:GntR family transcriptional regulator [Bacteroidales bacterium]